MGGNIPVKDIEYRYRPEEFKRNADAFLNRCRHKKRLVASPSTSPLWAAALGYTTAMIHILSLLKI